MCKRSYFFLIVFLLFFNVAHSMINVDQVDGFSFGFKLYMGSYVKNSENYKLLDFKKSKLNLSYKLNDKFDVSISTSYTKRDKLNLDNVYFNYHINDSSVLSVGSISALFDMYFEKSEDHLSIIVPTVNKATSFFAKTKGLGFVYKNNINDNFTFHVSFVGKNLNNSHDDRNIFTLRAFYFNEYKNNLIHVGLNNNFIHNDKENVNTVAVNNIYTKFPVKKLNSTGIEFASRIKSLTIESGAFYAKINPFVNELSHKYFDSYSIYSEVTYVVTGEVKNYDKLNGVIKKIKVKNPVSQGGIGAIELVARYQFTDAISERGNYTIDMGRHNIFLFGVNWLPTNHCKVLLNYSTIDSSHRNKNKERNNNFRAEYRLFF